MRKQITVRVTESDIDRGIRNDPLACAIAVAMGRVCPGKRFCVNGMFVDVYGAGYKDHMATYKLPYRAAQFQDDYDAGRDVGELTFAASLYQDE